MARALGVVVVGENVALRDALAKTLREQGCVVEALERADVRAALMNGLAPDLVLLDFDENPSEAWAAYEELTHRAELRVVGYSSFALERPSPIPMLQKPIDEGHLAALVDRAAYASDAARMVR